MKKIDQKRASLIEGVGVGMGVSGMGSGRVCMYQLHKCPVLTIRTCLPNLPTCFSKLRLIGRAAKQ